MNRKKQFRLMILKHRYPDSYTDRGFFLTKKAKKKMVKESKDPFGKFESDKWNSNYGKKLKK